MSLLRALIIALSLCTVSLVAQTPAPARQAPDISGSWTATFETGIGEMSYVYQFKVAANGVLTGSAAGPLGKSDLTEGSVKGDAVTFVEMMDGAIKVIYTGTITNPSEIKFSRVVGDFGTETLVARRAPAAQ